MNRSLRALLPLFVATRLVINTMIRMVYPFLRAFATGLGVDLYTISIALTYRSAAGIFGPFLGSVADSRGRKTGMLLGLLLFTSGALAVAIWPSYPAFVLALVLTMVGNFVFMPSMQAYLGDRVPYKRRGLALALTELSWGMAFIVGVPLVGWLIGRYGWRAPFPFLAALAGLAMLVLGWALPGDPAPADGRPGLWGNLRQVLHCHPALAGLGMGFSMAAANEAVNLVFGVWTQDAFGFTLTSLGLVAALIGVSELGGESLVGALADRLGKPRSVALGILINSLAALSLPLLGHGWVGALAGLLLFYISFEFSIVSALPLMTEVLPSARATLMAVFVGSISLGRSLSALIAIPLYNRGILAIALVAVFFDLLALFFLRLVKIPDETAEQGSGIVLP